MKSRFTGILTLFLAFMIQFSFAQEKTITGVVTSAEDGLPLPGVTVMVDGTAKGTSTDLDGKYSITANQGDTLTFSFIETKSQTITVGASNTINVSLVSDTIIDDVLVVGYAVSTKGDFVGTASKVQMENITAKTVSNVSQALKGEVAGVNVISGSGQPGTSATVRIRGFGSVSTIGNRSPLYVVDGIPYNDGSYGSAISSINPADIEDMTVLKDAAATSIYGSRGANGVILITTKSGKAGTSVITVDFKTSINTLFLPGYDVVTSPEEYMEMSWNAVYNKGTLLGEADPAAYANANLFGGTGINAHYNIWNAPGEALIDPATGKFNSGISRRYTPENWADSSFRTGYRQEGNIQFSGGTEKTRFSSSFGFTEDEGYGIHSDYTRYSTRLNVDHQVNDWLKAGSNLSYSGSRFTRNGQTEDTGSIFLMANGAPSIYSVYLRDDNGEKVINPNTGHYFYDFGTVYPRRFSPLTNGIADATYGLNRDYYHTLTGKMFFNANITKDLVFETSYGAQYESNLGYNMTNVEAITGNPARTGYLSRYDVQSTNQNFLQLLRYGKKFGDHRVDAFVAHETTEYQEKILGGAKQNAIIFGATDLDLYTQVVSRPYSYTRGWALESYFANLNYNYDGKYHLSGSVRRDGSSRFIQDKWGTFWSVGAGWVVSKESFMDNVGVVDYLKLKASYGVIGDQGRRLRYGWQESTIGDTDDYSFTETSEMANPNLTWETSKITQVGFESSWFKNRLDVDVDYYVKNTENLFFSMSLPPSAGYNNVYVNDGELRNSGVEFDVTGHIITAKETGDFTLSVGVNGEFLTNKLTKMPVDILTGEKKVIDGALSEGHSVYDHFMAEWAGVDPATGMALWNMYFDDVNGDGMFDSGDAIINNMVLYLDENPDAVVARTTTNDYSNATQKYVGKSAIPKVRGAFRLNASYKNFDLTAQIGYSIGGYAYDGNYSWLMTNSLIGSDNWHTDMRDRWQQPGDITNVPRLSDNYTTDTRQNSTSTRFLTKADYLSLNNVRLGYTFPNSFLDKSGLSGLSIYVSGDNLMFLSARNGFNPSTAESGGSNIYRYMPLSTFSLGVNVKL